MLFISVIICTRKPREGCFNRVLNALRTQTLPKDKWELLLLGVPNNGPFDVSWHPNVRYIPEEGIGLALARMTGISTSNSDLLVFVDDDNVLRADYLENALKISSNYPFLGAWGGSCVPEFETEPPVELRPFLAGLLVEKRTTSVWTNIPRAGDALPPGAGMVVRKKQALYYREQALHHPLRNSLGPHNKPPRGADDSDLALSGFKIGLGHGMFPELELTHLIPAYKLNLGFFENLYESFGYGGTLVHLIYDPEGKYGPPLWRIPPSVLKSFLLWIAMIAKRKSRAERRIRLAQERGRIRVLRDWQRWG